MRVFALLRIGLVGACAVVALWLAFALPAFKAPDEPAHFRRAAQIAGGEMVWRDRTPRGSAGGYLDTGLRDFVQALEPVQGVPSAAQLAAAGGVAWSGQRVIAGFANTAPYGPLLYAPQAAVIGLGQAFSVSVNHTYLAARLVVAALFVLAMVAALRLDHGRNLLVLATLSLPMTWFLAASVSQDALLIACGALVAALLGRGASGCGTWVERLAVAGLVTAMGMARAPYVLMALLLLAPAWRGGGSAWRPIAWLPAVLPLVVVAGWGAMSNALGTGLGRSGMDIDPARQMQFLTANFFLVPAIAWNTITGQAEFLAASTIGMLGWLDVRLQPVWVYGFGVAGLAAAALCCASGRAMRVGAASRVVGLGVCLGVVGALFLAQYLTWTPLGALEVQGVQGRYFLPLLPVCGVLLAGLVRMGEGTRDRLGIACCACLLVLMAIALRHLAAAYRLG